MFTPIRLSIPFANRIRTFWLQSKLEVLFENYRAENLTFANPQL